ncbi:MAG TPA: hypothetical protein VLY87_01635 [Flavobacterium sp.]|nr:hypothetical protein [Flavobacterium sp.]
MNANFLFPSKFKRLGVLLIVSPFLLAVFLKAVNFESTIYTADFIKILFQAIMCLGLFFMIYSKYKEDDEMLYMIRLQITVQSLFLGIIYLIISPLADVFVFKDEIIQHSAMKIIMFILMWQNFIFHYKRYQLKKELKNS